MAAAKQMKGPAEAGHYISGIAIASRYGGRIAMADEELNEQIDVPPPGDDDRDEHDRIRTSNDIDQRMEREGIVSQHNRGYDEAAKGIRPTRLD